jgi:ABC-type transport system involved in multi-copper enzyme maturation permease subunit
VTRLLGSEFLRLRSRRLVWVLAALALGGITFGMTIASVKSTPADPLRLDQLAMVLKASAFPLIVLGLVVGASAVGAELQTGSMTTLLTWESRRIRVLVVRLVVIAVTVFIVVAVLESFLGAGFAAAAWARGSTTVPSGWFSEVEGVLARVALFATAMAVIGAAIATIGRNTAAALGAVFIYLALAENLFRAFLPRLTPFELSINAVVFLDGRSGSPSTAVIITPLRAAVTIAVYVLVLAAAATVLFHERDVT